MEVNIFNDQEVIHLSKEWIKLNKKYAEKPDFDGGEMYYQGICSGVEFVLHLMKRMGD